MPTYAAIPVNRNTVLEIFAHASDLPDGRARLAWALFKFPWVDGVDYFFIGGNYLNRAGQPDYALQILRKSQLDSYFTYNQKAAERRNGPRNNGSWFAVTTREGVIIRGPRSKSREEISA